MLKPKVLIAAFGSTLRSDDAVGPAALKFLEEDLRSDQRFEGSLQLELKLQHEPLPELAAELADVDYVIFVDASSELAPGKISATSLEPTCSYGLGHSMEPGEILAACKALYGRFPRALVIAIGAKEFGLGETLSAEVRAAVPKVVSLLKAELTRVVESQG